MLKKNSSVIERDLKEISDQINDLFPKISGKTFLIAGGGGFLGRYLVSTLNHLNENSLIDHPCKIIIVDNFITGLKGWIEESPTIKLIQADISKPLQIEEPVDYIINAASLASPVFYNKYRLETIDVGFLGTKNLLQLAADKKVISLLSMSSSEVYGDPPADQIPTNEEYLGNVSCTGARACYDEPKRIGETLCMNYADIFNIPVKIVRPFNIFGPGIRLDDGRVVPAFVSAALRGEKIPLYGGGTKTRTFCYISNATVGFFKILLSEGNKEVYNIGADDPEIQIRHLADIIQGLVDHKDAEIHVMEGPSDIYKKSDPSRRCPDLSKIRMNLGYNPRVNLITGLKRFIEWVQEELSKDQISVEYEKSCRVCSSNELKKFISLGKSPLANSLLQEADLNKQDELYPLEVMYCPSCHNCQLSYVVDRDKLFKQYNYVSSTTQTFKDHFNQMASHIKSQFNLNSSSLVVDIGSNDGILLKPLKEQGINVMGVEPAQNIVDIARKNGIDTISDYFNESVVDSILKVKGNADVITANNVFAHTEDIADLATQAKRLLKEDGVFIVEAQYILDTIRTLTFDNIYHEHIHYFSVLALNEFFKRQGMEIFKVEHVNTHGGSIRVYTQKKDASHPIDSSVSQFLEREREFGLDKLETYEAFAQKVYSIRDSIKKHVQEQKSQGKKIVGYGSPAKATTLLNFCGITNNEIEFIIDDNPLKQGLTVPGVRIPIKGNSALSESHPDNIMILAWNFADEIMKNNAHHQANGTKFIVPLPEPRVL